MTSQSSSPNIAIKSGEQQANSMTVEDRRTYWKGIISNIPNQKGGKTGKAVTFTLKYSKIIITQVFKIIICDSRKNHAFAVSATLPILHPPIGSIVTNIYHLC